jgi:PAS domain S-box-containing protein
LFELIVAKRDIGDAIAGDMLRRSWEFCFKRTSRGITVVDDDAGTIVSLNPALAEMHGGTVGDFVGKPLGILFAPDWVAQIPDTSKTLGQNTFISHDSEHVRLDGGVFPVHTEVVAAREDAGDVQYRIAWYDDLTERQAAERRAGLAERDFESGNAGLSPYAELKNDPRLPRRGSLCNYGFSPIPLEVVTPVQIAGEVEIHFSVKE